MCDGVAGPIGASPAQPIHPAAREQFGGRLLACNSDVVGYFGQRPDRRILLSGATLLAVTALMVSPPPAEHTSEAGSNDAREASVDLIDDEASAVLAVGGGPATAPGSSGTSRSPGPLRGLSGAATALSIGDASMALSLLDDVDAGDVGSETWFTVGAMQGRAQRLMGKHADAVATLEPRAAHKKLASRFPKEVLLLELAEARVAYAASGALSVADADSQRRKAIGELRTAGKQSPIRSLPRMTVLKAIATAQIQGTSGHATRVAAAKGVKAVDNIIKEYPNHPMVGVHMLLRADALERAGKTKDAAEAYRQIAIDRPGEPEEAEAWAAYERIVADNRKINKRELLLTERLSQAQNARVLRRVKRSRGILDDIIEDPDTPSYFLKEARSSRSWTAYKQRDFKTCVEDTKPAYERTGNVDLRSRLLRCLERGEMYDEAVELELEKTKTKRRGLKAAAYWSALQLAFRGGQYAKTEELLAKYEKLSNANRGERTWLKAWLAYRQGRHEEAIEAFAAVPRRSPKDATRSRYFRGKLMLASSQGEVKKDGVTQLQQLAAAQPWSYYGLQARQRLLAAGQEAPPLPKLEPIKDEADRPSRADATTLLRKLDDNYGKAWPPIHRMRQLYAAGYAEEARRELRVATTAFLGLSSKTRSEEIIEGLGWRSNWKFPKVRPTKAGRKTLRDREAREEITAGLRTLAKAVDEIPSWVRLIPSSEAPRRVRWHPRAYRAAIEREARVRDIDPIHLWSLMYTESRFRRHVVSHVGARGALQIMPWTGRQLVERLDEIPTGRFDADTLFDIDTNSHLASYYISELLAKFQGQGAMAYASYNGGPSNVARWLRAKSKGPDELELDTFIEEMVFTESYRYAKRVMEVSAAYSMLYEGKLPTWTNEVDTKIEDNISF